MKKIVSSMTGFGRASKAFDQVTLVVECKSLNSRHLEVNFKLPRIHGALELDLKQLVQSKLTRGRVEIVVSRRAEIAESSAEISEQGKFVFQIKKQLADLENQYSLLGVTLDSPQKFELARQLLSSNANFSEEEQLTDKEKEILKELIVQAVTELSQHRAEEGRRLVVDLLARLSQIRKDTDIIKSKAQDNPANIRARVSERVKASLAEIVKLDEARLMQEIVLLIDKADITEELVRLDSHLQLFIETLASGGLVGKKLDFVCQEIFRELNTLGGKSANAEIQALVVDCKVELERVREQVQNLE